VKHGLKEVQEISQDITHSEEPANHGELAATN
jgi:hypothetical protein